MEQRRILETDKALLSDWISRDPHHRETTTADFFYEQGTHCILYSDVSGPVFFMRTKPYMDGDIKAIRLDIQFDNDQRVRNGRMLLWADGDFSHRVKKAGFQKLVFDSTSEPLIQFCCSFLGFNNDNGTLTKRLT